MLNTALAPIVLFVYRRVDHLRRTIDALARNPEARESDLIVFSDGPKGDADKSEVQAVRAFLRTISGFRTIQINERFSNMGLARSIIAGVSEVIDRSERVIVMEDDIVTSPHFLRYMNDGLQNYAEDDRIASIHGYVYPVRQALPETFFLRGADCWGWGTWHRAWNLFNPNGQELLTEITQKNLEHKFDFDGTSDYTAMLKEQIAGINDSWAIRWYASAFLSDKLTLYPGRSLVHNIGNDSSGVHCEEGVRYDVKLTKTPIVVGGAPVEDSSVARAAFIDFWRQDKRPLGVRARVRRIIRHLWLGR